MKNVEDTKKIEREDEKNTTTQTQGTTKDQHKQIDPGGADLGPDLPFIYGY